MVPASDWIFHQEFFRQHLELGEGGETGVDNDIVCRTFERTGVSIMGKRMFELGERMWPKEAPLHTSVFVVTHEVREPWVRPGGTTFYFVNDGIESALESGGKRLGIDAETLAASSEPATPPTDGFFDEVL